jgi:chemotaxis protein methyltransferase CheR
MMHADAASSTAENFPSASGLFTITQKEFVVFRELIFKEAGISLSDAKRALVCSRLSRRLRHFGFKTFTQYYDYLMHSDAAGAELLQMINCITTNKTDFFRESHHFDFLREFFFPQVRERALWGHAKRLRIWSAGCSSGEEPYTIGLVAREFFGVLPGWDVKILASDVDTEMLRIGAQGIYPAERLESVPLELRKRHFLRGRGEWAGYYRVRNELRELVTFRRINFADDPWPINTRFDLIFCRNVIIYFNRETQRKFFERLARYLHPYGCLMVGHSESLQWLSDLFVPLSGTIYRLKDPRRDR